MDNEDDTERLADYRAGRMGTADAEAFRARLDAEPGAAAWDRLAEGIKAAEDKGTEAAPGGFGWARLSRSIDAETPANSTAAPSGWHVPLWQVAAALVLGIGLWQVAVVPRISDGVGPGYTTTSGAESGIVRVMFAPEATAADIAALLRAEAAVIVDGPSAVGLYSITATDGRAAEALAAALGAAAGVVASATLP